MGLPASRMRFIALSATLPNANDFGSFLGADVFRFGDEYRPVSLQVCRVLRQWIPQRKNVFRSTLNSCGDRYLAYWSPAPDPSCLP